MAHLSGLLLIDCPASALNNAGAVEDARTDNTVAVKRISSKAGVFPYVSAQAFRYWLRSILSKMDGWTSSPVFREGKIAYTDANPIQYAEDDVFGYMRAPSGSAEAKKLREEQGIDNKATAMQDKVTLTRQSPLKVSTLVSIAPLREVTTDFGVMARQEGNAVPFEHEFYRTTLSGLYSMDLAMLGRFYSVNRSGFKHLDEVRLKQAIELKLAPFDDGRAYELPLAERKNRLSKVLLALGELTGGAKLAMHYTDVAPKLLIMAVTKGGNHIFSTAVGADAKGLPLIKHDAIKEIARVYKDEIISGMYVGLPQGYLDEQRAELSATLNEISKGAEYNNRCTFLGHPREAIKKLLADLETEASVWLA
ncbi:MAG: DevR family CRISPR-associated autoregulator [Bacillota bacterium]|nr:MAG: DevR family CRISPR-associated autoregulator [Bacillota bacterium]